MIRLIRVLFHRLRRKYSFDPALVRAARKIAPYMAALLIYLIVCGFLLKYLVLGAGNDIGARASVGQLIADLVLLPVIIFGFGIAIAEFRAVMAHPVLQLEWNYGWGQGSKARTVRISGTANEVSVLGFAIRNTGTAVAVWYEIALELPWSATGYPPQYALRETVGEASNWEGSRDTQLENVVVFRSNGRYAVYPDSAMRLATLMLQLNPRLEPGTVVTLPYRIVGERVRPVSGELILKIAPL